MGTTKEGISLAPQMAEFGHYQAIDVTRERILREIASMSPRATLDACAARER
ncbi:MAG: hypothetical protein IT535_08660 [Bauldia sp.]|nr:hypothetical protein [Bauldia sp.]